MDENQKDHLKAYGAAFWIVGEQINVEWVLNFRGGSFIVDYYQILNLNKIDRSKKYYIYSGIGNPKSFESILKKNKIKIAETAIYPDHYTYSNKNFVAIINEAKKYNAEILTTEKDYVKVPYKFKKYFQFIKLDLVLSDEKKFMKFLKLKLND